MPEAEKKRLEWDKTGERYYETGVDQGVLFVQNKDGSYKNGVAWSGLTAVNQSTDGGEPTKLYADNMVYLTMYSAEEFNPTIECYTYPHEFGVCNGEVELDDGISISQQERVGFGFAYRTKIGNDVGGDAGYKIHLVYGAKASPAEKNYETVNDNPDAITFSYETTTTPVAVTGFKPTAHLEISSLKVDSAKLKAFEDVLYGSAAAASRLPLPDEVKELFAAG